MSRVVGWIGGACAGCALLSLPVHAAESGPYVKLELGPAITEDVTVKEFLGIAPGSEIEFDPGIRFSAGGGYSFNDIIALGGEVGFSYNSIDRISGNISEGDSGIGNAPFLANVVFKLPNRSRIVPYAGAGAGVSWAFLYADNITDGSTFVLDGDDATAVFAWQAFGGVKVQINDQMSLGVTYKYLYADDPEWEAEDVFTGFESDLRISELKTHTVAFVFTFKF
ncbi:MAG: porin family protein [Verrucomicrobia subdivision 3 bacterium]|nr:porin family protein [Limisphaerales bacterium]